MGLGDPSRVIELPPWTGRISAVLCIVHPFPSVFTPVLPSGRTPHAQHLPAAAGCPLLLTTAQAQLLKDLARVEVKLTGYHPQTVWTAFQHHFEINSYLNLPANRFEDACAYFNARKNHLSQTAAPNQSSTEIQPGLYLENLHHLCKLKGLQKEADGIIQTAFNGLENLLGLS